MKGFFIYCFVLYAFTNLCVNAATTIDAVSPIAKELWMSRFLGKIKKVIFPFHSKETMLSVLSDNSLSLIDMKDNNIIYKKYLSDITYTDVVSNEKNILLVNNNHNYVELFTLKNGQHVFNIDNNNINSNNSDNTGSTSKAHAIQLQNKKYIQLYMTHERFVVFNNDKVLFDTKVKENINHYDFYIDNNNNNNQDEQYIHYVSTNNTHVYVSTIPTLKINKNANTVKHAFTFNKAIDYIALSKDYIYIFTNTNEVYITSYTGDIITTLHAEYTNALFIQTLPHDNSIVIVHKHKIIFITQQNTSIETTNQYDICSVSHSDKSLYCFKTNTNTIDYHIYSIPTGKTNNNSNNNSSLSFITNSIVQSIAIHPSKPNYIAITTDKALYLYDISKSTNPIHLFDNNISNIVYSRLLSFEPLTINKASTSTTDKHYYTTMESNEVGNVFANAVHIIVKDIIDIFNTLKDSLMNYKQMNVISRFTSGNEFTLTQSSSLRSSLFLYTNNSDLFVLNALNGEIEFTQAFDSELLLFKVQPQDNTRDNVLRKQSDMNVNLHFKNINNNNEYIYEYNLLSNQLQLHNEQTYTHQYKQMIMNAEMKMITNKQDTINLSTVIKDMPQHIKNDLNGKYSITQHDNTLYTFKYYLNTNNDLIINIVYNLHFEEIITYFFPDMNAHPNPMYLVEGKIYYKFLNENIIVILSKHQTKHLLITLIRGDNGKVIDKIQLTNIDFNSISYLFEDNWGLLSYIKKEKGFRRNEVFAIELLKQEIEFSLMSLLEKHFKSSTTTTNTVTTADTEITILSHTFVLDRHVKKMFKSQTEYNNANTFIMLLYENNKIYLVDRRTFSPRRPFTKDVKGKETFDATINSIYVDPELKGYKPIVLVDSKAVLDAKRELTEVNDVVVAPTQSESTFMVCSIGNDVACYKVFPDKIYDSYNKGTQAVIIVIFTIVFGMCIGFVRRYVKRKEFKNVFLNDAI